MRWPVFLVLVACGLATVQQAERQCFERPCSRRLPVARSASESLPADMLGLVLG